MPVNHKFLNYHFPNGFQSNNAILEILPYEPETIFVGTFNHGWDWNFADFYYGRGMYMWPILANLFLHHGNVILNQRTQNINPTINDIYSVCALAKISFADIVKGTFENIQCQILNNAIIVDNHYEWNSYKDTQLNYMGNKGWLDDNVEDIIKYINKTPSIKHVYFTFASQDWLGDKRNLIRHGINVEDCCSIFTPSANGFGHNLPNYPNRLTSLSHCWIWNGLNHEHPVNRPNFGHLSHGWLIEKGVNPNWF